MYEKLIEQAQNAAKPMSELFTINTKAFEALAEKQTNLVKDIMNESVSYVKDVSSQKDFAGIYEKQKTFAEGMQEKLVGASKDAYAVISGAQEEATALYQDVVKDIQAPVAKAAKATAKA